MQETRTENHEPIKHPKDMNTKEETMQAKINLLEKNAKYVFGAKNVKYVDNSLAEVKDGRATGTAMVALTSILRIEDLNRFMEFYPVIHICPGYNGNLLLTIDTEKMNEEEAEEVTEYEPNNTDEE